MWAYLFCGGIITMGLLMGGFLWVAYEITLEKERGDRGE